MAVPWALEVQRFAEARAPELQSLFAALRPPGKNGESEGGEKLASAVETPARDRRRTRSHNRRKHLFWTRKNGRKTAEKKQKPAKAQKQQNAGETSGKAPEAEQQKEPEDDEQQQKASTSDAKSRKRELKVASLSRRVRRRIEFQAVVQGKGSCPRDGAQRLVTHVWHAKRFSMMKRWGYWLPKGIPGRGKGAKAVLRWASQGAVLHDSSYYNAIQLEASQSELSEILSRVLEPMSFLASGSPRGAKLGCYFKVMVHRSEKVPFSAIAPATVVFSPRKGVNNTEKAWIWIHGGAFDEALQSLRTACEGYPNASCRSRRGELARMEISGKKSFEILQRILKPQSPAAVSLQKFLSENENSMENAWLPLEVYDPREAPLLKNYSEVILCEEDNSSQDFMIVQDSKNVCLWRRLMEQVPASDQASALWEAFEGVKPPSSEKAINKKQRKHRLARFRLGGNKEAGYDSNWTSCPIILLRHDYKIFPGCSIILPVTWVHAFWMPFVLAGARVAGQTEQRWLMTHGGFASFPYDYPDCSSYKEHILAELQERVEINERKPPQKRLACVPCPSWIEATSSASAEADERSCYSGFVARSRFLLNSYLRLRGLRSFPGVPDGNGGESDENGWGALESQSSCFCRMVIVAVRRGVPEEGSVLRAPNPDDFQAWQDSCGDRWQGIDTKAGERREIGFVTSAAPPHSRDAAIAFCDVREISELRSWQKLGSETQVFLLFQNSGSSMLRPALASSVLEL